MYKPHRGNDFLLGIICILLIIGMYVVNNTAVIEQDPLFNTKLTAYELIDEYMSTIRSLKSDMSIEMSEEDIHKTGMIGLSNSSITTSLGSIEAKRTSAIPDMAALVVELLYKAGVRSGDVIGANFSGSFPSLNLAVLAASKAMNVNCIYITSIGASNYGANNPDLTFPDMVIKLKENGLIESNGAAFSIGGTDDIGLYMDETAKSKIVNRLQSNGLNLINRSNYQDNLEKRQIIFEKDGRIKCFVNVGGNTTSLGEGESSFYFGQGLLVSKSIPITKNSGLIEIYRNKGIPVIHLLNLRKLTSDYGLAYDPTVIPKKGTSSLFIKLSYNSIISFAFITISIIVLIIYKKKCYHTRY